MEREKVYKYLDLEGKSENTNHSITEKEEYLQKLKEEYEINDVGYSKFNLQYRHDYTLYIGISEELRKDIILALNKDIVRDRQKLDSILNQMSEL